VARLCQVRASLHPPSVTLGLLHARRRCSAPVGARPLAAPSEPVSSAGVLVPLDDTSLFVRRPVRFEVGAIWCCQGNRKSRQPALPPILDGRVSSAGVLVPLDDTSLFVRRPVRFEVGAIWCCQRNRKSRQPAPPSPFCGLMGRNWCKDHLCRNLPPRPCRAADAAGFGWRCWHARSSCPRSP
jgi:hypothetical protein